MPACVVVRFKKPLYAVRRSMHEDIVDKVVGIDEYAEHEHMTVRYNDVRVPDDFRMRKIVLRDKHDDVAADLFNSLSYEPIPANKITQSSRAKHSLCALHDEDSARYVAAPFAVLRFLFVDIWALSLIIERTHDDHLRHRQNFLFKLAVSLFDWIIDGAATMDILFPTTYIGIYMLESAAKRMQTRGKPIKGPMSANDKKELIAIREKILDQMKIGFTSCDDVESSQPIK